MNRLACESSQYLRQHADNPVDWYAWGEEAFAAARERDTAILLSIGYSSCHWCHVMAHESFEDPLVAELMNELFVNVKVDREELPDVDSVYMDAVQALTGHGGWPLTVFLTPDGRPFWGGTYFPREPRHGMPSIMQVLRTMHDTYAGERQRVDSIADELTKTVASSAPPAGDEALLEADLVDRVAGALLRRFDPEWGGFETAPKFPAPMALELLLRAHVMHRGTHEASVLQGAITTTLDRMLWGGVYDQVGGGFHRYSVDGQWLVPHFEKMLYDNAQLTRTYLHGWKVTGAERHLRATTETLDYLVREMRVESGAIAASQDADSGGVEGSYYVFSPAELAEVLGPDDGAWVAQLYQATESGNFDGSNVLSLAGEPSADEWTRLEPLRVRLRDFRASRVAPDTDHKVVAAWNGLALAAFAEAGAALGREDYLDVADGIARHLVDVQSVDGALHRTWTAGAHGANGGDSAAVLGAPGYAEDYASVAFGMLSLYEATFDERWLLVARGMADTLIADFEDAEHGGFYANSAQHDSLVVRPRDITDHPVPSGNSMAATVLARLHHHFPERGYDASARRAVALLAQALDRMPSMLAQAAIALDHLTATPHELVLVGDPAAEPVSTMLADARAAYRPHMAIAVAHHSDLPLFAGRTGNGAAAFLCSAGTCSLPLQDPDELRTQLEGVF